MFKKVSCDIFSFLETPNTLGGIASVPIETAYRVIVVMFVAVSFAPRECRCQFG